METSARQDRTERVVRSSHGKPVIVPADDLVVAQRRMRHLAPWDIKPLPMMHSVAGSPDESPPPEGERNNELKLHLLAVHMSQAAPKTALR